MRHRYTIRYKDGHSETHSFSVKNKAKNKEHKKLFKKSALNRALVKTKRDERQKWDNALLRFSEFTLWLHENDEFWKRLTELQLLADEHNRDVYEYEIRPLLEHYELTDSLFDAEDVMLLWRRFVRRARKKGIMYDDRYLD